MGFNSSLNLMLTWNSTTFHRRCVLALLRSGSSIISWTLASSAGFPSLEDLIDLVHHCGSSRRLRRACNAYGVLPALHSVYSPRWSSFFSSSSSSRRPHHLLVVHITFSSSTSLSCRPQHLLIVLSSIFLSLPALIVLSIYHLCFSGSSFSRSITCSFFGFIVAFITCSFFVFVVLSISVHSPSHRPCNLSHLSFSSS